MTEHYDLDGNRIDLTEEDRDAIAEEIKVIDFELPRSGDAWVRELMRRRRHLIAELAAGWRLPLQDEEE